MTKVRIPRFEEVIAEASELDMEHLMMLGYLAGDELEQKNVTAAESVPNVTLDTSEIDAMFSEPIFYPVKEKPTSRRNGERRLRTRTKALRRMTTMPRYFRMNYLEDNGLNVLGRYKKGNAALSADRDYHYLNQAYKMEREKISRKEFRKLCDEILAEPVAFGEQDA